MKGKEGSNRLGNATVYDVLGVSDKKEEESSEASRSSMYGTFDSSDLCF